MMDSAAHGASELHEDAADDYGTSRGFFSFASQLGRQLTQDAMDLSTSAVETAKYLAVESTKVVEKASLLAQESLAEAFDAPEETPLDLIAELPWMDDEGHIHENVKDGVFAISRSKSNFSTLSLVTLQPVFDIDRFVQIAPALLALDEHLRQRHFELSYKLAEDVFWGNYFYHCHVLRVENGLSPYLSTLGTTLHVPDVSSTTDNNQLHDDGSLHDEESAVSVADEENDHFDGDGDSNQTIHETDKQRHPSTPSSSSSATTFSNMKSNLLHRSVQAKQKMQNIKRKIHFPSPEKMKELQSSLLRRRSSMSESFERMSITGMSFSGLKRSPSLVRYRSKSAASEPDDVDTDRLSELGTPPSATAERTQFFDD
ncbi:hypothetical protein H310_06231 [Aphanomyces invadans]|uniref:BSD domain-containing protein n=1 Tax=Aphanomyces invadans TaxID=157072 RepID=A0A024U5T9_9STRA|nr:hypothetical protein H310_06231 [Aphanomyces invadans]ETW01590.1 hypothetical protein H310_06231 [Aphanomyces invadans]|eukprot:XP_008869438.1 hypothetical protein H310_06231 [Aphanomyces invadans]